MRKYTGADVELLVEMDRANEDVCGVAAKLFGQVTGLAPRLHQFNHLLAKLRRIRQFGNRHFGLLL
ncbi:hypothetical protein [Rhodoferax ferrireducens]|uniref:hypothetical protein n=1 Tax=Rhodoferax ferrireducens TaxID=192843 RepID=UPI000E0DF24E|nr:hypothetical protein [Rhodoferax ferrireducens]